MSQVKDLETCLTEVFCELLSGYGADMEEDTLSVKQLDKPKDLPLDAGGISTYNQDYVTDILGKTISDDKMVHIEFHDDTMRREIVRGVKDALNKLTNVWSIHSANDIYFHGRIEDLEPVLADKTALRGSIAIGVLSLVKKDCIGEDVFAHEIGNTNQHDRKITLT